MSNTPVKLKASQVEAVREKLRNKNGLVCALCRLPITAYASVLDHDHDTGAIRDTIHRGCNSLLGKVENNYKRYGVPNLAAFCHGLASYLQTHAVNRTGLLHPTHKTEDEKREARNRKARLARAKAKNHAG